MFGTSNRMSESPVGSGDNHVQCETEEEAFRRLAEVRENDPETLYVKCGSATYYRQAGVCWRYDYNRDAGWANVTAVAQQYQSNA